MGCNTSQEQKTAQGENGDLANIEDSQQPPEDNASKKKTKKQKSTESAKLSNGTEKTEAGMAHFKYILFKEFKLSVLLRLIQ